MPDEVKFMMVGIVTILFVMWAVVFTEPRGERREFTPIQIHAFSAYRFPHAQTSGRVTISRREDDGDWHIRLTDDTGHFIVAEIIPELPRPHPQVGACVTVQGIVRYDKQHRWYELHPLINWWETPCTH